MKTILSLILITLLICPHQMMAMQALQKKQYEVVLDTQGLHDATALFNGQIKRYRDAEYTGKGNISWIARAQYTKNIIALLEGRIQTVRSTQNNTAHLEALKNALQEYARSGLRGYQNRYLKPISPNEQAAYDTLLTVLKERGKFAYEVFGISTFRGGWNTPMRRELLSDIATDEYKNLSQN